MLAIYTPLSLNGPIRYGLFLILVLLYHRFFCFEYFLALFLLLFRHPIKWKLLFIVEHWTYLFYETIDRLATIMRHISCYCNAKMIVDYGIFSLTYWFLLRCADPKSLILCYNEWNYVHKKGGVRSVVLQYTLIQLHWTHNISIRVSVSAQQNKDDQIVELMDVSIEFYEANKFHKWTINCTCFQAIFDS